MPSTNTRSVNIQSLNRFSLAFRTGGLILIGLIAYGWGYAQTPVPSPSPAPTPITKTDILLVNNPSTVGRITKWVSSSKNGIGTIGDSVITESSVGTIGIGTNPFSDFKLAVNGGSTLGGLYGYSAFGIGVYGKSDRPQQGVGVYGEGIGGGNNGGIGVFGRNDLHIGVLGQGSTAVQGIGNTGNGVGVGGLGNSFGVVGDSPSGIGIFGKSTSGLAGRFDGNVTINGGLTATSVNASNLSSAGTINSPSNPIDWSALKNVPSSIASGEVVNSVNGLSSAVTLVAGDNVTITPSANTLTISAAAATSSSPAFNPLQIATLRWYGVNEAQPNINVGNIQPLGVAFDGANMWVVNFTCEGCQGVVSKHRLSDGAVAGSFNVGLAPVFATFDGSNIWVGNRDSNNVTKLRASDGTVLGTFLTGGNAPQWLAFDGANIWVTNTYSNTVTKMRPSDGSVINTFPTGQNPHGVVFDGRNVWIANNLGNSVTKLRASDGLAQGTFPVGSGPIQMAFDGSNIWVSNLNSNTVTKLRASDGATLGTFNVGSPHGIAFDGVNIWVVSRFANTVTKLRASDGSVLATSVVGNAPWGIAFDGINMWISNYGTNSLSKR